jgi:hypothetical protein
MILTLKQKYAWSKFNPILRLKCYRELQGGGGKTMWSGILNV